MPSIDSATLARADALRQSGDWAGAAAAYREAIAGIELVPANLCLRLARCAEQTGDREESLRWLLRVVDDEQGAVAWQAAASRLPGLLDDWAPPAKRTAKLAVLGSYTTVPFDAMLRLAALRFGVLLEVHEAPYGQYQQELLDPSSASLAFGPDLVLLALHHGAIELPAFADDPDAAVAAEVDRLRTLWQRAEAAGARVIQHNIVPPPCAPLGHLSTKIPGCRETMLRRLNLELGAAAGAGVAIVDCARLAAAYGTAHWYDERFWLLAKQAVAPAALPLLARHTAAVIAAMLGLSRKCIVLDLDNTLWGGVIGEDGLDGIALGSGPAGEAFVALQHHLRALKQKGLILAACSKNNDADAREVFERHPEMILKLDDFAAFVANWESKPDNLRQIAEALDIGLDALVFVDDNPAEREIVRQMLPEVEVVTLPTDPCGYVNALAQCLHLETAAWTAEDIRRTEQYQARAAIHELQSSSTSIEDFHKSLQMQARVGPFEAIDLPRIVQLIGKTNQFNLTTRRHGPAEVRTFMDDPQCVTLALRLRDRFTDHGLVSVLIARACRARYCVPSEGAPNVDDAPTSETTPDRPKPPHPAPAEGGTLHIDTWLMSCRVIGRTVENETLAHLCRAAERLGCTRLRGTYIPTAKNALAAEVFKRFGFEQVETDSDADLPEGATIWQYDLAAHGPIESPFITAWAETENAQVGAGA